ncbi:MAG: 30S ribosome-binding factor RbfA [Candidatus Omnitrophota bacterium]
MIDRMDRVSEAIKREISLILQEKIKDPRISGLSITKVEVSRDLRTAKAYFLKFSDEHEIQVIEKILKRAASFIRSELAGRAKMKFTPKLTFLEDKEEEAEENIERTFDVIEKEHEKTDESGEGTENE